MLLTRLLLQLQEAICLITEIPMKAMHKDSCVKNEHRAEYLIIRETIKNKE